MIEGGEKCNKGSHKEPSHTRFPFSHFNICVYYYQAGLSLESPQSDKGHTFLHNGGNSESSCGWFCWAFSTPGMMMDSITLTLYWTCHFIAFLYYLLLSPSFPVCQLSLSAVKGFYFTLCGGHYLAQVFIASRLQRGERSGGENDKYSHKPNRTEAPYAYKMFTI